MGLFKKLVSKGLGAVKGIVKGGIGSVGSFIAATPIGSAAKNLLGSVKGAIGGASTSKPSTTITSDAVRSMAQSASAKSSGSSSNSPGLFSKYWDMLKTRMNGLKTSNPIMYWLMWLIIVALTSATLYFLFRLVMWLGKKFSGRGNRSATTRNRSRTRATAPSVASFSTSGKKKTSSKVLAALARGRAKRLANLRKKK